MDKEKLKSQIRLIFDEALGGSNKKYRENITGHENIVWDSVEDAILQAIDGAS